MLQYSSYRLAGLGRIICSIDFLFDPTDTRLPQWLIPQLNEILLKIQR